jgi:hypothetical protein
MPNGFLVHSFAGDDPIQCKDYVRARLGLPAWQPGDEQDRRVHPSRVKDWDRTIADSQANLRDRIEDDLLRIKRAQALWNEAADPRGTMAVQYLMARALDLADDLGGAVPASALSLAERRRWQNRRIPALSRHFARLTATTSPPSTAFALTAQRWPKADRRMLGLVHRRRQARSDRNTLMVGEGIETCMAARQLMSAVTERPVWALECRSNFFPSIDDHDIILGESGEASAQAVRLSGQRWQHAGRRVQVLYSEIGSDVNDALMMEKMAQ